MYPINTMCLGMNVLNSIYPMCQCMNVSYISNVSMYERILCILCVIGMNVSYKYPMCLGMNVFYISYVYRYACILCV